MIVRWSGVRYVQLALSGLLLASATPASADSLGNFVSRLIETVIGSAYGSLTPEQEISEIEDAWEDFHIGDPDNLFRPDFFRVPDPNPPSGFWLFHDFAPDPLDPGFVLPFDADLQWPDPLFDFPVPHRMRFEFLEHPELIDPTQFNGLSDPQFWDLLKPNLTLVGYSSDFANGFPMHFTLRGFEPILFAIAEDANGNDLLGTRMIAVLPTVRLLVPEPATWTTLLIGFGAIGAAVRRQRRGVAARQ